MSKSIEDQFEILHGRLLAQNRIFAAIFGYIMVADTSAAHGMISVLTGISENANESVGDEPGPQKGFQVELSHL